MNFNMNLNCLPNDFYWMTFILAELLDDFYLISLLDDFLA